jgi:hypothetical protein
MTGSTVHPVTEGPTADAAVPDIAITPEDRACVAAWHERDALRLRLRRAWRIDASILAVVTVLLRLPMLFADRALVFDDGVFGASALAMRAGELPFRDVFSSQGPLFLPLVFVADLVGLRTSDAPRLLSVASGVVVTIAVYACGRRLTTRGGALLAAGLVTTSGSVLWVTGPINADGPALALSVVAVAVALRYRDDPRLLDAVLVGLAGGAALSIKFLAVPAVLVAGVVVLASHRRMRDAVTAGTVAVGVYVVTALPWGIGRVWQQSYTYHADARRQGSVGDALVKILRTLWERDLAVVVALLLAGAVWLLVRMTVVERAPIPTRRLTPEAAGAAVWAVLVVAVLLYEPALWRAHVAHLVVPLALLAALRPPPWRVLIAAALVVVPVSIAERGDVLRPSGYDGHEAALVRYLQTSGPDAEFLSDDPGLVWRADRSIPGDFVDSSFQRIDNRDITTDSVASAARDDHVCGVIVTSRDRFWRLDGLADALAAQDHLSSVRQFGPRITLYRLTGPLRNCPAHG